MARARRTTIALSALLLSACADCRMYAPGHAIVTDGSGRKMCGQHHIALVTAPGYTMNVARVPTIDPGNAQEIRLEQCNPNAMAATRTGLWAHAQNL